jgi:hypothetical protein
MNAAQAEALFKAERDGVRQIYGSLHDGRGGFCAMGVLLQHASLAWDCIDRSLRGGLNRRVDTCPLCGATKQTLYPHIRIHDETDLITHYNNDHKMTFGEIARKLGPDSV